MTSPALPTKSALLFDLDGTLADTALDIAGALDATLAQLGLPAAGIAQTRDWIGGGAPMLVRRAITALTTSASESLLDAALALFMEHYQRHNASRCTLYPGVAQTLAKLSQQQIAMACVTNKPQRFAVQVLNKFDLQGYFPVVIGGDSLAEKKPHPLPLHRALTELGCEADSSWMIGDSATDVSAARNAGMQVAWVSYGYHQGLTEQDLKPDRVCHEFSQVGTLLGG